MNEAYWDRLIEGHLDGGLSEAEQAEFTALLRDSEAARSRFWELAEVHGLARDAARIAWPESELDDEVARKVSPLVVSSARGLVAWFRPVGLVAAGLVLGILTTGLAWAIALPQRDSVKVLLAESFESTPPPTAGGVPIVPDVWSGDFSELVEAQSGVQPASARRMLRFLRADYAGKPNPGGYISEVYRLLDVRGRRRELVDGDGVVQVSALFNAAPFTTDEKYHYSLSMFALDQETATSGATRSGSTVMDQCLASTRRSNDLLDHDSHTWQKMSAELRLPPNTDFLLLRISVAHGGRSRESQGHEKFTAHYADDVRVVFARRPLLP
jgi:hypothetical protein